MPRTHKKVDKAEELLDAHKATIIEELGASAFEQLTPQEAATVIGVDTKRLPDLLREKWLEPTGRKVGNANFYYRWRAVFVQRYRKTRHDNQKLTTP